MTTPPDEHRQVQHYRPAGRDETYCGISPAPPMPFGPVTICEPCWEGLKADRSRKGKIPRRR